MPRLGDTACLPWEILRASLWGYVPFLGDTTCLTWGIPHALLEETLHASWILTQKASSDGNCYLQYTVSKVSLTANALADSIGERVRSRPGNNGHLCSDRREAA